MAAIAFIRLTSIPLVALRLVYVISISAQSVIVKTKSIGNRVNQIFFPDCRNQTVIASKVKAAKSWFEAPKSVQYRIHAPGGETSKIIPGTATVITVPRIAPKVPLRPVNS